MNIDDWKSQIKRGTLEFCILLMIKQRPSYGYEIISTLEKYPILAAKENTIYPLLRRLMKEDYVSSSWQESAEGLPPRKYYSVTDKGLEYISAISEEFGLIFSIALFLVCLNNLILMMNIASRCKTLFYRLVAVGLGVTYGVQVFLTVGGAIKFIPMTGVTLPFVSYGGSSILSSLIMFALINGMYNMRQDEGDRKDGRKQKTGQTKKKTKHTK